MASAEAIRPDGIGVASIVTPNHLHCAKLDAILAMADTTTQGQN